MNGDLKQTFIRKCLSEYMMSVMDSMRIAAKRYKVGVTEEGISSMSYKVIQQGGGMAGQLSFKEYLRFVDMGVGKGHPLGGMDALKEKVRSKSTRKPKKIYSKTAYGKLSWLQGKLLYGFTEETVAMLKSQISNQS